MPGAAQQWSSRFGFLMASIGFAVGLGNIWRFPYMTGENGGSAFVLVYLLCAFGIGVPILMAEIMLGRGGGLTPPGSVAAVAADNGRSRRWSMLGYLNLVTAFCILVGYGVVAGWVLYYFAQSLAGVTAGFDAETSSAHFDALLMDVPTLVGWMFASLMIAGVIIYGGVEKGIERAVIWLMPLLFLLLVAGAVFNAVVGGMPETLQYLFTLDLSKVTPGMVLAAVGQAFFSIGVAMAGMMMFGAYLPRHISIGNNAIVIVVADTLVALLAGLVIFPIVFHNGLDPAGGTGLIFKTLPVAFAQMPGGRFISVLFFLLLAVAAITSLVGMSEPIGAWFSERFGWNRHKASMVLIGTAVSVGLMNVLSFNQWSAVTVWGRRLNDLMEYIPNQVFLPLGGLLIAFFVGWIIAPDYSRRELALENPGVFRCWHGLMRFVVVPVVLVIFVTGVTE